MTAGTVNVLDVRTPREYAAKGHIPGAILVPVDQVPRRLGEIPRDGKPLLICCEHGVRSEVAASFLFQQGYADLLNLAGGMASWAGPREFGDGEK